MIQQNFSQRNKTKGSNERISLVDLVKNNKWDDVIQRLQTSRGKEEASTFESSYIIRYPIHVACNYPALPLNVAVALLIAYPDGVQHQNIFCYLPIHVAAKYNNSIDVVNLLLEKYPLGLQQETVDGDLPVHTAALYNTSIDVIDRLIEIYPAGIRHKNINGNLPIHCAAFNNSSIDVINLVLETYPYPQGIQQQNNAGALPIHQAAYNNSSIDVMIFLRDKYPEGVRQQNNMGRLPIHLLCNHLLYRWNNISKETELIHFLIQKYPEGLRQKDNDGFLPVHVAAISHQSINLIYILLKNYPEVCSVQQQNYKVIKHERLKKRRMC